MQAIVLIGGPGAGKGTLSDFLKRQAGFIHVSTGDMFRAAIRSGSAVGSEAKSYIEAGVLVPDSIVLKIIEERIDLEGPAAHFMFDGFPRTLAQAEGLDSLFKIKNRKLSHVFNLTISRDLLIPRLTGRRVCKQCGAVYHILNRPPQRAGLCDVDSGELYQRADDHEGTILNRLEVYDNQTAPLIDFYHKKKLIYHIDAGKTPEQVAELVLNTIRI